MTIKEKWFQISFIVQGIYDQNYELECQVTHAMKISKITLLFLDHWNWKNENKKYFIFSFNKTFHFDDIYLGSYIIFDVHIFWSLDTKGILRVKPAWKHWNMLFKAKAFQRHSEIMIGFW